MNGVNIENTNIVSEIIDSIIDKVVCDTDDNKSVIELTNINVNINKDDKWFEIEGIETPQGKKVKWGLAKDDVTPKDIFRMTNEGSKSRAIVAKYCIQDCNLVHYLFNKVDVITDLVEMSKLCSVPMSFLILRR